MIDAKNYRYNESFGDKRRHTITFQYYYVIFLDQDSVIKFWFSTKVGLVYILRLSVLCSHTSR